MVHAFNFKKPIHWDKNGQEIIFDLVNDLYIPVLYVDEGKWKRIVDGDIIFDWLIYVKSVLKTNDVVTHEERDGNLYLYQWGSSIDIIKTVMRSKTEYYDIEWSRQSGKTYHLEHIIGFLTVFGRRYKSDLKGNKWMTITLSHKDDSVVKNFINIRKNTKSAVDIYNKLYGTPTHNLVYNKYKVGGESKYAFDTDWKLKIDVVMGETSQDWAEIYAITAKADQDGYSGAKLVYVDEAILIDAKQFIRSILPFATVNGGSIIVTGIASTDSGCLQARVHEMESSKKIIYTCDDVYKYMKMTSPKEAETFKDSIESQIEACGGKNSTEAQTNYYMSWEISNGKFVTRTQLEKNDVYETELGSINHNADFVVAGLDLSLANDYTVLTIGETYKHSYTTKRYGIPDLEEGFKHYVKDIITYNFDRQRMDANELARKTARYCRDYKISMIMIDNTANQGTQVQLIYEAILKEGINTLVVPFDFSGSANKVTMLGYVESVLFSGRCKLPKEEYKKSYKSYEVFLDEMLCLIKVKEDGKQNVQYKAPRGKTDDHFFSFCLMIYCVQHVINLKSKNKLIEIGTKKIFPRLNKFKLLSEIENKKERQYLYANVF